MNNHKNIVNYSYYVLYTHTQYLLKSYLQVPSEGIRTYPKGDYSICGNTICIILYEIIYLQRKIKKYHFEESLRALLFLAFSKLILELRNNFIFFVLEISWRKGDIKNERKKSF